MCFLKLKRAWRAFSFKCSSETLKLPVEGIRVPKYVYSWTMSMVSLPIWNSRLEFFFARFWKIITLVFLQFISNIQELQKEDSVLRQFCNPILDRDIIIKSSAYKSEFNLVPFGRMIGSDKVFWNADGKSLTYKLKSKGLKIQPWRTPRE